MRRSLAQWFRGCFLAALQSSGEAHVRSLHQGRYDLRALSKINKALAPLIFTSPKTKDLTVDWADSASVFELNKSLLMQHYGVGEEYTLGPHQGKHLIPPVPSRADMIHHCADLLLAEKKKAEISCLDIGCGASAILSLIGAAVYGWRVVASDVSRAALDLAELNVKTSAHRDRIFLRLQSNPTHIFREIVRTEEFFDLTVCNPPFYSSQREAQAASQRKIKNLGLGEKRNFGGTSDELWCKGGELAFIRRMIDESLLFRTQLGWVTCLVSDKDHVELLRADLKAKGVTRVQVVDFENGNKKARVLAWHC